jgi:gliding motility-associated-like protein
LHVIYFMKQHWFYIIFILLYGVATNVAAQVHFIENKGQWNGDFDYKLRLKYGALYFKQNSIRFHLSNSADMNAAFGEEAHHHVGGGHNRTIQHHVWDQRFIGANTVSLTGREKAAFHHNYFKGDPKNWRGNVPVYKALNYSEVYPGIAIHYFQDEEKLKYNWIAKPGADISQIKWDYPGADSVWIAENQLIISTSVGFVTEQLPAVYTELNGIQTPVDAAFVRKGNYYTFELGAYDQNATLIIDPAIVFASFTGSLADNWGFTATYDQQGNVYAGGIVFENGYPITTGAFQIGHANPTPPGAGQDDGEIDVSISKFNAQGNALVYSTYLGGTSQDQPHSMFVDSTGHLYVFGVTGSADFPLTPNGYDTSFGGGDSIFYLDSYAFPNGTDIFVVKFNPSGSALVGGTFIGGSANDGLNLRIAKNYGDLARGEIVVADDNDVYITASTLSADFPSVNGTQGMGGKQEAVALRLSSNLTSIVWSTFYGGIENDAGYGIKVGTNGSVYITGSTEGSALNGSTNGVNSTYQGGTHDGFIARFNKNTGALQSATYVGTNSYDQSFLIDLDKFNNVYVFGQTGGNYPVTAGAYFNANAKQFLHKFNSSLNTSVFSTCFGRGRNTVDIVPIALNVDNCLNILLSGWGGNTNNNSGFLGGYTLDMPITPDAAQSTTDGSDLYFAVFGPNADSLKYGSYYGGTSTSEHVDGGTSRFDPGGTIYQAVCAGCGGNSRFPTTPGAYSNSNNSSNCNLAVVKINFETRIAANAIIDTNTAIDTNCNTLTLSLLNLSKNANSYLWDFGNGTTSSAKNPTISYDSLGTYTIKLIATDTLCDVSDSVEIVINHDQGTKPRAQFNTTYTSCDVFRTLSIANNTTRANQYNWSFGDGFTSTLQNPVHQYANEGTYTVTLIAVDTTCGARDTALEVVDFTNNIPAPEVSIGSDSCFYGGINVSYANDSSWYQYEWNFNGTIEKRKYPTYRYPTAGTFSFSLTIIDTLCNTQYTFDFTEEIERIEDRVYIPNAFTPNRDMVNEEFIIAGNECLSNAHFQIFDSFGNMIFETDNPFNEFWDGYINGKPAQQDVYVYYFKSNEFEKHGTITVFY